MPINDAHPEYQEMAPRWKRCRDVAGGSDARPVPSDVAGLPEEPADVVDPCDPASNAPAPTPTATAITRNPTANTGLTDRSPIPAC